MPSGKLKTATRNVCQAEQIRRPDTCLLSYLFSLASAKLFPKLKNLWSLTEKIQFAAGCSLYSRIIYFV